MRFILVFFSIIYFNGNLHSQTLLLQEFTEYWDVGNPGWYNEQLVSNTYNEDNKIIKQEISNWDTASQSWVTKRTSELTYNEFNQLTLLEESWYLNANIGGIPIVDFRKQYFEYNDAHLLTLDSLVQGSLNSVLDIFIKVKKYDYTEFYAPATIEYWEGFINPGIELTQTDIYEYDENECLKYYYDIPNYANAPTQRTEYEYFENCKIQRETFAIFSSSLNDYRPSNRRTYSYENEFVETQLNETYFSISQTWGFSTMRKLMYNQNHQVVLDSLVLENGNEYLSYHFFDEKGNNIGEDAYLKTEENTDFILESQFKYDYQYNDQDWITAKRWELNYIISNGFFVRNDSWEYYCDGKVKTERIELLSNGRITAKHYIYDKPTDCAEEKPNQTLKVFPNPTNGILQISSNLLSAQNNQVNIYSTDGRFIRTAKVDFRTEEMTLDLSDLSNGIYFIEVKNEEGRLTKKVIIAK